MVREGRVLTSVNTDPDFGANYYVTAYEVGAQVTASSSGTTIGVRSGHGFATGDKFIVLSEFPSTTKMRTVSGTGSNTINVGNAVSVSAGDILINLAADGELVAGTPNYDGNGLAVYTTMSYTTQANNNTVQCDANGKYRYFHKGLAIWELVRTSSGVPFTAYLDAGISAVTGPDSTTDNAIVRWDGTTGESVKDSVVTVSNSGAVTGVTTLNASDLITSAGVTSSGLITGSAGVTVATGQALTLSGTSTLSSSSGAATLGGGIAGGIPRNIGTWSITAVSNGTAQPPSVTTIYTGSIFVPANMTITGIQYIRGAGAVGTIKTIVSLHNSSGAVLANSNTAGTTIGTASQKQQVPFTATYAAVGPAWYHIGIMFDGTTADTFKTIPAYCDSGSGVVGDAFTGKTFGTVASFTPSTVFVLNTVPVASIY